MIKIVFEEYAYCKHHLDFTLPFIQQNKKLTTLVEDDPKAPSSIEESVTTFSGLLHFTLDHCLTALSTKQGGIKYHLLSIWEDSTWD